MAHGWQDRPLPEGCRRSEGPAACFVARFVRLRRGGQREREGRALAADALHADLAAEALDDRAADIQPQAEAHSRPALDRNALDAVEALPDALLLAACQPRPLVLHRDPRALAFLLRPDVDR